MINYQERKYRILRSPGKNGKYTTRVSIPREMLQDLGITEESDRITFKRVENGILLQKA